MSNHYDPNQPRNAEGEWTDAYGTNLAAAIREAASDKKDDLLYIDGVDKAETGKPIEAKAYRFEKGIGDDKIKFYSKNQDYAEQYASLFKGGSSDVKEHTVIMKNPLVINVPNKLFSSPAYENPIINKVIGSKYDGIVFKNQEDIFYVTIKN